MNVLQKPAEIDLAEYQKVFNWGILKISGEGQSYQSPVPNYENLLLPQTYTLFNADLQITCLKPTENSIILSLLSHNDWIKVGSFLYIKSPSPNSPLLLLPFEYKRPLFD